jgi:hypothetical protein
MTGTNRALLFAFLGLALSACGIPSASPEQVLRETISRAAQAAEKRELGTLRDFVSGRYRDELGYDREGVLRLVRATLLVHSSVHVVARVKVVQFPAPKQAIVSVIAGMAGRRIAAGEDTRGLDMNLFRFEIAFAEESPGAWRVTSARWQPASLTEAL